jgi:uncharacterized protein YndB with AHSA1/START domain
MTLLRITEHVEVPPEKVFELGIDFKRYPEWNVSYSEVKEIVGPPDVVGTKIHSVMKVLGRPIEGWGEIVEIEKPRLLKLVGTGDQGGKLTQIYRLTPVTSGTDVEIEVEYELPAGFLGQIVDKLFVEKTIERDLRHTVENFKAFLEAKVPVLA